MSRYASPTVPIRSKLRIILTITRDFKSGDKALGCSRDCSFKSRSSSSLDGSLELDGREMVDGNMTHFASNKILQAKVYSYLEN